MCNGEAANYETKELFLKPASKSQALNCNYWYDDRKATNSTVTKFIQRAANEVGLDAGTGSGFTGHSIRATAVTQLAENGVQDSEIMVLTGHRASSSLKSYSNPKTLRVLTNRM